ncbi:MAG: 4-alpha-glucanotransferase [Prevotellaceae bacterium]|nr:4-alpha-glucanotransferase [Prevotellaceae bacterium]
MTEITLQIDYRTEEGQRLQVCWTDDENGWNTTPMTAGKDGRTWRIALQTRHAHGLLQYRYAVVSANDGRTLRNEEGGLRKVRLQGKSRLLLADSWTAQPALPAEALSTAFETCVYRCEKPGSLTAGYRLRLIALPAPEGWHWCVSGAARSLGAWATEGIVRLLRTGTYEWSAPLRATDFRQGMEYKYLLRNDADPTQLRWEEGLNRRLLPLKLGAGQAAVLTDMLPRLPMKRWRGAGVVIPVFSLRSCESHGTGDFGDLARFVEWAAGVGLKAVQLLPVNDTTATFTWRDSYPYSGISVFALHPLYLDLRPWRKSEIYCRHEAEGQRLNALDELDYEAVIRSKMAFLEELCNKTANNLMRTKAYAEFARRNASWLDAYADFSARRDAQGTADFRKWDTTPAEKRAVRFYKFVQFLLHRQLSQVHELARRLGVILKGDIPIGICRDSVPARQDARLFHFDGQAGAPPDDFARQGQNWGFPTYNWKKMEKDGYAWWRERLGHMAEYFDAYRIDHVLGFFRIWEIPFDQLYGLMGRFRPALPLTPDEIRSYGFGENAARLARPLFSHEEAERLGPDVQPYLEPDGESGLLRLRSAVATGRRVRASGCDGELRARLEKLTAEVLFIEDPERPGTYHPRVAAQQTRRYALLSESDKRAFDRLSDDFFYRRHTTFWSKEAMKKLPALTGATRMLACAEDLGMVPDGVKEVLDRLGILSLEIQRMPKRCGRRFDKLSENPYFSVSTIATHDMPPLRLWWKDNAAARTAYWHEVLGRDGETPAEASPEICEEIIAAHLESPSMLCLLALQDWLAADGNLRRPDAAAEQINIPADPEHYWRYRMHLTIEDLVAATSFNEKVRALVRRSGR